MSDFTALFRSRIVGFTYKRASQLVANPFNWRTHPQRQRDAVHASLSELGWIAPVIENVRTGHLVDGHERVWQALPNDEEVPVLLVDLSEQEEKLALAILDPLTYMAETDSAALRALLADIHTDDPALNTLLEGMEFDFAGHGVVPTLSELEEEFGEGDPRAFWPLIRLAVAPETHLLFQDLLQQAEGEDDAARMAVLLQAVDRDRLTTPQETDPFAAPALEIPE